MTRIARQEAGAVLLMALLGIFILVAIGAYMLLAVDRNTDLRAAYQKSVAGFDAAEAGLNVGAAAALSTMQDFGLPTDCSPQTVLVNARTVTYTLSVPGGTAGSCAETPLNLPEPASSPFAGLNAIVYTYNLTSSATNAAGFTEATVSNQFLANLIPVFQFAAFYKNDLEYLPGPPLVVNGRLHTNGDLYLNSDSCGSPISAGMNILGKITIVGSGIPGTAPLNRGRKDSNVNHDNVYISLDGTPANMQVLGTNAQGGTSCSQVGTRRVPQAEINTWNGRISTGLTNINLPTTSGLLCTPWLAGCAQAGAYWQHADLRIALDRSAVPEHLVSGPGAAGPPLFPVKVLAADGNVDAAKTASLKSFMTDSLKGVGAITYSDIPKSVGTNWDCRQHPDCESSTYAVGTITQYAQPFPQTGVDGCTAPRGPRQAITAGNYCNDYRFGGFYNWRESKPILMLNIDWIALAEWNRTHANALFNPDSATNGGPVIFVTVRGPNSSNANDYGVRIFDAARLPRDTTNTGVTFASDQAMYIVGNFNCSSPDFSGGDTLPAACGAAERPSSAVADTLNVLSCAWVQAGACGTFSTDTDQWAGVGVYRPLDENSTNQSASCGSGCPAEQTVVNAAFLAGNDRTWCKPTTGNDTGLNCGDTSWYSGGLENYPRFHENWQPSSGIKKFWYQGSFVSLDVPHHTCYAFVTQLIPTSNDPDFSCGAHAKQGFWSTQRYVPPARRWFYHVGYNDAASLPPLTPRFVYLKLIYFTEVFQ